MRHLKALTLAGATTAAMMGASSVAYAACDEILLGSAMSFTGKYSTNGVHAKNGYDLGVKKINEMGGVEIGDTCYNFKIKYYDDKSTPARTAQLLERLIKQDGIRYFLGPYSSDTTKAAAPVMEKHRVPMVEAQGASRSLFNKGYKYLFAVLSTSEQYLASSVALAAEMAKKDGKKPGNVRVAMAFETDPFSRDVRAGVLDDVRKHGLKVVIDDKLPRDLSDMSATLTKVKALKPDLLVVSGHSKGAATAFRQIGEKKVETPMIAITHCEAAKATEKFPKVANGILCPTQWAETLSYNGPWFGSAAEYDKAFKAEFKDYKNVPYQSAQATAAVLVFADAFKRAQSLDPAKVRDAIAATDLKTFYGNIKFSKAGNNIAKPMVLRQIQDGKYNVVAPSEWASHNVEYPRRAP